MIDRACLDRVAAQPLLETIVESSPDGIIVLDAELRVGFWNRVVADWTGVDAEQALGSRIDGVLPEFSRGRYALRMRAVVERGTPVVLHGSVNPGLLAANGREPRLEHYRITCRRLQCDDQVCIVLWIQNTSLLDETVGYLQDEIDARRRAEAEVENAARSHEILYRELQHRVKNTLSLISSLVSLSRYSAGTDDISAALSDIEARIESIVLVYNQLAARSRYGELDLAAYLGQLVDSIVGSIVSPPGMGDPDVRLDSVVVSVDTAISIGLIVNELVTNSVKHAFRRDRPGRIRVLLAAADDGFELEVSDDGVGMPDDAPPDDVSSLGLGIVRLLAEQIGAELVTLGPPGAGHRLRLSQSSPPSFPQVE